MKHLIKPYLFLFFITTMLANCLQQLIGMPDTVLKYTEGEPFVSKGSRVVGFAMFDVGRDKIVVTSNTQNFIEAWYTKLLFDIGITNTKKFDIKDAHKRTVITAEISRDRNFIVTASWDSTAKIWDAKTGNLLFTLAGHALPLNSAVFSPNGRLIVTTSQDKTAKIWEFKDNKWEDKYPLIGHESFVNSAVFSPDGSFIVTASKDGTVKVWSVETGYCGYTFYKELILPGDTTPHNIKKAEFSPNGLEIIMIIGNKVLTWKQQ